MTFGFVPIGPWSVVKEPQYVEEDSFGIPPANPTFKLCGNLSNLSISSTNQVLDTRYVGPSARDISSSVQLGLEHSFDISYIPSDLDFMHYGTDLVPICEEKSITLIEQVMLNCVPKYITFKGCVCDKISVKISRSAGMSCTQSFFAKDAIDYTDQPPAPITTPNWAPPHDITKDPWTGITSGEDPLTWDNEHYPVKEFNFDVAMNAIKLETNGTKSFEYAAQGNRDITFSYGTWNKNGKLLGDMKNMNKRDLKYVIAKTPEAVFEAKFTNAHLRDYKWAQASGANDFVMEQWTGRAYNVELTETPVT